MIELGAIITNIESILSLIKDEQLPYLRGGGQGQILSGLQGNLSATTLILL